MQGKTLGKRKFVRVRIEKLKPHPKQASLFRDASDEEIEQLAEVMNRDGQNDPVEILPDHVIICGHQRVRAGKKLGWDTILCWVRHDLAEEGDAAVEHRLIEDNLVRRQLSPLDVARCYLQLKEIERDGWAARDHAKQDFRDYVGTRFGISGKTLDRWATIVQAPMPIQCAVDDKLVTDGVAIRIVTKLDPEIQSRIAKKIEATRKRGGSKKEIKQRCRAIINNYLPQPDGRPKGSYTAWSRLKKSLEIAQQSLGEDASKITFAISREDRNTLRKSMKMLRGLVEQGKTNDKKRTAALLRLGERRQRPSDDDAA